MQSEREDESGNALAGLGRSLRRLIKGRPVSFYLFLAVLLVLVLGLQLVYVRGRPRAFAALLSLLFAFSFLVLWRALVEAMELIRDHFSARERVFRSVLGDPEFTDALAERLDKNREDS